MNQKIVGEAASTPNAEKESRNTERLMSIGVIAVLIIIAICISCFNIYKEEEREREASLEFAKENLRVQAINQLEDMINNESTDIDSGQTQRKLYPYIKANDLFQNGKCEEAKEILETLAGYEDADDICKQIEWEQKAVECFNIICTTHPDYNFTLVGATFYQYEEKKLDETESELATKFMNDYDVGTEPVCIIYATVYGRMISEDDNLAFYSVMKSNENSSNEIVAVK